MASFFLATFEETIAATDTNIRLRNPLGFIPESAWDRFINVPWTIMLLTTVTFCVASVFVRYRCAAAQERTQIKWFLSACTVFLMVYQLGFFLSDDVLLDVWTSIVFELAFLTIPTTIGFAILHHRLYDIDLIIRRTLTYGALTATLAAVYFSSVTALQTVLRPVVGVASNVITVASTLTIATLFQPLRRRI